MNHFLQERHIPCSSCLEMEQIKDLDPETGRCHACDEKEVDISEEV